jgi:hypothetical protein
MFVMWSVPRVFAPRTRFLVVASATRHPLSPDQFVHDADLAQSFGFSGRPDVVADPSEIIGRVPARFIAGGQFVADSDFLPVRTSSLTELDVDAPAPPAAGSRVDVWLKPANGGSYSLAISDVPVVAVRVSNSHGDDFFPSKLRLLVKLPTGWNKPATNDTLVAIPSSANSETPAPQKDTPATPPAK